MKISPVLPAIAMIIPMTLTACGGMHRRGDLDPARADQQLTEHLEDVLDDVKASDAQRARILAIKSRLLPEVTALVASKRQVRQEVVAQLASDHPDAARLHALVDLQIAALRVIAHKSVDGIVEAHGTLTPEQRAPLVKKMRRFARR
jgi:Spy/CpxP family protein refolding chaperone